MVRERRKSFYEATRRIADLANTFSQSTIVESPKRKRTKRQDSPEPPYRRSNRLRGIRAAECSLSSVTRRQTRSTKTKGNLRNRTESIDDLPSNNVEILEQPQKIQNRRATVAVERLSQETINEWLGIECPPQSDLSSSQPARNIVQVSPRKITSHRCSVYLERMDMSSYRVLPTIEEQAQLEDDIQPPELNVEQPESDVQTPESDIQLPDFDMPIDRFEDVTIEPIEDIPMIDAARQSQNDAQTYVNAFSSIISDQNISLYFQAARPSTPSPPRRMSLEDRPLTPSKLVQDMMDTEFENSQCTTISLDHDYNDTQSTYFHMPIEPTRATIPFRNRCLQSSQTNTQISWNLHRSVSDDSIAVGYSQSTSDYFSDAGVIKPKKGFIDSNRISYGPFVKYQTDTFAVNFFDHGNEAIQNHFLSKFCRSYFAALNAQFKGHLYTTEITARLMRKYSSINEDQMHTLTYGEKTSIGNALVTAIEVPYFPGGALFLFEAKNQKKIIHVGNFRLTSELEDASLINSIIDEIRFDESILSSIFYHSPVDVDRYMDLMNETNKFIQSSNVNGLKSVVVFGASEIGMEFLIHRLAANFNAKVYMSPERRTFLECMKLRYDEDTPVQKLLKILETNRKDAFIHVLPIEEIAKENLMDYICRDDNNFHRVLGIRPRGCDAQLQKLIDGAHKIVDIANPLIGDIAEYERFIYAHTDKQIREPADHIKNLEIVPYRPPEVE